MFNIFTFIYDVLATLSFIIFYPFVLVARLHTGKDSGTRLTKLGLFNPPELGDKVIMYHAVSVGEVMSLEKLLKKTKEAYPDYKLVLTTGTKTGQELAHKKYSEIVDYITYLPFDIPFAVNNFFNRIKPSVVLIAETELWPDFAMHAKKRKIPVIIINGRISDESFKSYKLLKPFFSVILNLYTKICTQSELDRERFIAIGNKPENTVVMKNLKFDIDKPDSDIDLKKGDNRVLIAGSTHHEENPIVIRTYDKLKQKHSNLKLIIAPRHLERISGIEKLLSDYNYAVGSRSKNDNFTDKDIIILDTLGELKKCYATADIAFIGGSFNKTGGHNPLEAAIFGVPTISGPSIKNFRDIYAILQRAGASEVVKNEKEFLEVLDKLLSDSQVLANAEKACEGIFDDQKGSLEFVINEIKTYL